MLISATYLKSIEIENAMALNSDISKLYYSDKAIPKQMSTETEIDIYTGYKR